MKKKSKVYFSMYLSYLIILSVPILMSSIMYVYTLNITRSQTERINKTMLEIVQRDLDQRLTEVAKISQRLSVDMNVQKAANVKGAFTAEDQYLLYTLYNELQSINLSEEIIRDIFICFNNTHVVASIRGNMSDELYYHLYYESEDYTLERFREYMAGFHYEETLDLRRNTGNGVLLFTTSTLNPSVFEPFATIGIALNLEEIQKSLDTMKWDSQVDIMIINSQNEMISQTYTDDRQFTMDYESLTAESYIDTVIDGKPCVVLARDSGRMDWKYVTVIPVHIFEKNASDIRRYNLLGLFGCIFTGITFSYYMVRRNYSPVKSLLELFQGHSKQKIEEGTNEYQWLREQMELFFGEHVNTMKTLYDNRKTLRSYCLYQCLEHLYTPDKIQENIIQYQLRLELPYNMVVMFVLDQTDEHQKISDEYIRENELHKFIVVNIFEELMLNYFNVEIVEMGAQVAAIINMPETSYTYTTLVKENIENMQQMLEDKFGFSVMALVGDIHEGVEGIHVSYQEVQEISEYMETLDTDLILYEDVRNLQRRYEYSMEVEQKIINAIKAGNQQLAADTINQVLTENFAGAVSIEVRRCLIFDMLGTLLKAADLGGYHSFAMEFDFTKQLSATLPLEALKQRFGQLVEAICSGISSMQKERSNDRHFGSEIEDFIEANYPNPDLNISIAAQHFDMTPSYLSTIYKKQTGKSLLDYINTVRITHAERLLSAGAAVVDVAGQVGFRDSGTFIRAFKKKRGITPGQMKRNV